MIPYMRRAILRPLPASRAAGFVRAQVVCRASAGSALAVLQTLEPAEQSSIFGAVCWRAMFALPMLW